MKTSPRTLKPMTMAEHMLDETILWDSKLKRYIVFRYDDLYDYVLKLEKDVQLLKDSANEK
jgi:hypothetical protein